MGKLSHIADVERRNAALEQEQLEQAQRALGGTHLQHQGQAVRREPGRAATSPQDAPARPREDMTAAEEEDFHGLSSVESMSIGQKFLIIAAVIVVLAAILYVLDSWFHFV